AEAPAGPSLHRTRRSLSGWRPPAARRARHHRAGHAGAPIARPPAESGLRAARRQVGPGLAQGPDVASASLLHEAPLEVLRQRPDVVLELLALAGQPLPTGLLSVTACATDVTEV